MANIPRNITWNGGTPQLLKTVINLNQNDTVTFQLSGFSPAQNGKITRIDYFTVVDDQQGNPSKGVAVGHWSRDNATSGTVTSETGYTLGNYYSFSTADDGNLVVTDVEDPNSDDPHWYTLTITWGTNSTKTFDPEMINKT